MLPGGPPSFPSSNCLLVPSRSWVPRRQSSASQMTHSMDYITFQEVTSSHSSTICLATRINPGTAFGVGTIYKEPTPRLETWGNPVKGSEVETRTSTFPMLPFPPLSSFLTEERSGNKSLILNFD